MDVIKARAQRYRADADLERFYEVFSNNAGWLDFQSEVNLSPAQYETFGVGGSRANYNSGTGILDLRADQYRQLYLSEPRRP